MPKSKKRRKSGRLGAASTVKLVISLWKMGFTVGFYFRRNASEGNAQIYEVHETPRVQDSTIIEFVPVQRLPIKFDSMLEVLQRLNSLHDEHPHPWSTATFPRIIFGNGVWERTPWSKPSNVELPLDWYS